MSKRMVEMMSFRDCDGVLVVDAAGTSFLSAYRREMAEISVKDTRFTAMADLLFRRDVIEKYEVSEGIMLIVRKLRADTRSCDWGN